MPLYIGGNNANNLRQTAKWGDGWLPAAVHIDRLREDVRTLRELASAEGRNPEEWPDMKVVVDAAVETRLAFSRHVEATLPDLEGSRNVLVDALAKGAGEIIAALIDGGIKIFETYQDASAVRRETIATRVEQQRWRTFSEVEAAL